jgi:mRNA interferase MazF
MNINRGEIWSVNLDPTIGAEIRKTRPVVVISSDAVGVLPIKSVMRSITAAIAAVIEY